MKQLTTITDPVYIKPDIETPFEKVFKKYIRDERDLPFIKLTLQISLTLLPLAVILYIPSVTGLVWWTAAILYQFLNNVTFKGPFGLMLHCTSHRVLFKKEYGFMNHYLPWIIAPLFGHS